MLISKQQFQSMPMEVQSEYLYFFSVWNERKAEAQAVEFSEKTAFILKSELTGMDLVKASKEFKIENHGQYESCLEDIERYEKRLRRIIDNLEK